jgi:hypothetical protein
MAIRIFPELIAPTPKVYREVYNNSNSTPGTPFSWTCPAGVTQIDLTLIGGGGSSGSVYSLLFSQIGLSFPGSSYGENSSGSTTYFTKSDNSYSDSAIGGAQGKNLGTQYNYAAGTQYGPGFTQASYSYEISTGTNPNVVSKTTRNPGSGGLPIIGANTIYHTLNDDYGGGTLKIPSYSIFTTGYGEDGKVLNKQVTVVPLATYNLTVGAGGGNSSTPDCGTSGAIYISYVK